MGLRRCEGIEWKVFDWSSKPVFHVYAPGEALEALSGVIEWVLVKKKKRLKKRKRKKKQ